MHVNNGARDTTARLSVPISFRLPEIQHDLLEAFARRDRVHKTQILREAFDQYALTRLREEKPTR